jgi:uncharacterized membrane protein
LRARLLKFITDLRDAFWIVPALLVAAGAALAEGALWVDRNYSAAGAHWSDADGGSGSGAQTMLGAIAASSIGVAGTVFSITIAALALAYSQMGPRLLRNFTYDRGNQFTLGAFLGTFAYALIVLRANGAPLAPSFVPHVALTVGISLAFICIAFLVYFVHHVASRINVETVILLEHDEMQRVMARLTLAEPEPQPVSVPNWGSASIIADQRQGYLQHFDLEALADWADERRIRLRLLVRPGDYVFPAAPIALVIGDCEGIDAAIRRATALGPRRVGSVDIEFAVRQLVEVAVRALSPGINDPHTAISVVERFGAALCGLVDRHLPTGRVLREGRLVVERPTTEYGGLCDLMFHMIRQNAQGMVSVLIRMIEVLTMVASCERAPDRLAMLERHGALVLADGLRTIGNRNDLDDLRDRHAKLARMLRDGPEPPSLLPQRQDAAQSQPRIETVCPP